GDDPQNLQPPASPTPSLKSTKSGRPSLFATFARRNSTKSEHSSRSRSPTSPRPSNDFNFASDGIRTPSPTPSRDSMIFERDIEPRDNLSVPEAIDRAIPPVLDDAAEAFVNEEIPTNLVESLTENGNSKIDSEILDAEGRKRLSLINVIDIVNNRAPSPSPFEQKSVVAETTPSEANGLTDVSE
ncbi:351_t:CDS:1, partial [Acaulospora morrowiae]